MRTFKSFFGLIAAFLPILYIGGFLLYFSSFNRATYGLFSRELSPTIFGLAAIGLVFVLLFALKLWRLATPPAPPRDRVGARTEATLEAEKSDFDPDAALARYMARRDAAPPADRPLSFGRKNS